MTLVLVEFLQPYYGPDGLHNSGEVAGLSSAVATALIAAGSAVEYNAGGGAGVPTASPFRGQGEWETDAQYEAAGGSSGNLSPSAAIQGYESAVSIVRGRAVPDSEPWA
jgi:hypothetical protein